MSVLLSARNSEGQYTKAHDHEQGSQKKCVFGERNTKFCRANMSMLNYMLILVP